LIEPARAGACEVCIVRTPVLIVLSALAVAAEPPAGTPPPLPDTVTIAQAVQEAVDHNLGLLAERYNVGIADARIITAGLRPNPVFTAAVDNQDLFGTRYYEIAGAPELNFRLDYTLERAHKRERRVEVSQQVREVAKLQLLNTTRQLVLDVQNAFVDVLAAKASLQLARDNLTAFQGIVEVNTTRVRVGDLAKVELVRSRVAALQFQNGVRQAESKLRVAANRLQSLLGRPSFSATFDVTGDLRRDPAALSAEELQRQALELRPDILALRRDEVRALAELKSQQAQAKVDYTVGTQYHQLYDVGKSSALSLFFSAPLPVYSRNQGEIERARREQEQVRVRTRAQEAVVASEVRNAWVQYETSRDLLLSIERELLEQAQDVRNTMEYSYRRGEASLVEFLDAQRAFNDARQSLNDARADYARSLYLMDSISGKAVTQ
jgi:outer membrane protein, heavy metal efflux system